MNQTTVSAGMPVDENILALIESKNEKGYSLLYNRYWTRLVNYTYTIVHEKYVAEEIVQNLLVSFYTKPLTLKHEIKLLPYLYTAIRNRVKNYYRSQHNYNKYITYQKTDNVISTDVIISPLHLIDLQNEIKRCLSKLTWKYTEVFLLNKEQGMTIKEISRQLKRPEGTVEKHLRKSLQFLKDNLNISLFKSV